jgi:hypothetical protein
VIVAPATGSATVLTTNVTVVGPPASVSVTANPTSVNCGQQVLITAKIVDAIGQNVSEHTVAEAITNIGGVLGGTGAVANLAGPVVPISSTVTETFSGVATFYLITSQSNVGPYQVIVTSGGGGALGGALGGLFSTPPVSGSVSVTCTNPAPPAPPAASAPSQAVPPRVGQGITPPNTGDAGLVAADNDSNLILFAIIGAVAMGLAGVATVKFARR